MIKPSGIGKRYILTLVTAVLIFAGCNTLENPVGPKQEVVKVKNETKWICSAITHEKDKKIYYKEYNIDGNILTYIEYNVTGDISSKSNYSYKNNVTQEQKTVFGSTGEIINKKNFIYELSNDGRIDKKITYNDSGLIENIMTYHYDDKGNVVKKTETTPDGMKSDVTSFTYSYNGDGLVVERITNQLDDGQFQSRDTLIYHRDLNSIEKINYNSLGTITNIVTFIYNTFGFIIQEFETESSGALVNKYIYEYAYYR